MRCIRFYKCTHGLRLPCDVRTRPVLDEMAFVEHRHVDIVQIHKANSIQDAQGSPYLLDVEKSGLLIVCSTEIPRYTYRAVGLIANIVLDF